MPSNVLDDLDAIRDLDKHGMVKLCVDMPAHSEKAIALAKPIQVEHAQPRAVIVAGMGGSAIGGELLQNWLASKTRVPIDVCRDYKLPAHADTDTLVFAVSYSGETEETLSAFHDAVKKDCRVVSVTSGGHLQALSEKHGFPCVVIPRDLPPRMAFPYLFFPLATVMLKLRLARGLEGEINEALKIIEKIAAQNSPSVPTNRNLAKSLAIKVKGTVPVVYAASQYAAVAHRWKTQFNENSKTPSKYEVFPELNHNEVVGWERSTELHRLFSVILLRDHDEDSRLKLKIELTKKIALRELKRLFEVYADGESTLAKMLSLLCVGDYVSIYLAVLNEVDPFPVKTITRIKEELSRKGEKPAHS